MADPKQAIQQALAQAGRGRLGPAIAALERLVAKRGAPAEAYHFLGLLLAQDGRVEQGIFHLERASGMSPGRAQFESNFANVLAGAGRVDEAVDRYRAALASDEGYAPARVGLAAVLLSKGELAQAEREARAGYGLAPENPDAAANLASCLITTGRAGEAVDHLREVIGVLGPSVQLQTLLAAAMNYDDRTTPEEHLEAHRMLGRLHAVAARPLGEGLPALKRLEPRGGPLRVGYLSADFRDHPVAMFIEPALEGGGAAGGSVEVFVYDLTPSPDAFSERLRAHPVTWREARGVNDAGLVSMIRRDGIDVLVELSGHSLGNRQTALAARAAPVQVSTLGYPATTGNPAVDVRLVDGRSDPAGSEAWCTEELVRLARCAWCFSPPREEIAASGAGREARAPVRFGSFNNLAKTTPAVLDVWARVLERVPGSTLTLKNGAFVDGPTRERVADAMAGRGVERERVRLLAPTEDTSGHLAAYHELDIALDTFPYAGTTTTCEAMWMGVPVVTLAGRMHAGRVGVSLLEAVGLDGLVAESREAYVDVAASLAADRERLASLRATLRGRMERSELMARSSFCAALHGAFAAMVEDRAAGGRG
ncbi:MAG: tetratricopeptide repeat protein [Phycisphaerales bacterium JB041]